MKETIESKLDKQWRNFVMDGTKPPVNRHLQKKLYTLFLKKSSQDNNTTTAPLIMVIYFENGRNK